MGFRLVCSEYSKSHHPVPLIPVPWQPWHKDSVIYCSWMSGWILLKRRRPQGKWQVGIMNRDTSHYQSSNSMTFFLLSLKCWWCDRFKILRITWLISYIGMHKIYSNLMTPYWSGVKRISDTIILLAKSQRITEHQVLHPFHRQRYQKVRGKYPPDLL